MPNLNFEVHGSRAVGKGSTPATITGVNSSAISGYANDRVVIVTPAMATTMGVPAGPYERVGFDASGNITYAPANRNL